MGWFGYGIMDGDKPLDALDEIFGVIGRVETDGLRWNIPSERLRWLVTTKFQNILDRIRKMPDYAQRTYWQVFAAIAMEQGVPIPVNTKTIMLKALDDDDEFGSNLMRRIYVREMSQTLLHYIGDEPTCMYGDLEKKYGLSEKDLDNPGLSQKMLQFSMRELAEHLKGKEWFRGVQFAVSRNGYVILVVAEEEHVEKDAKSILNDTDVPGELFDMQVMFSITNQNTVRCANDSICD